MSAENLLSALLEDVDVTVTEEENVDAGPSVEDIVNKVKALGSNVKVKVKGTWVWVSGDTYPVKNQLKDIGFKFSGKKKEWYFSTTPFVPSFKKNRGYTKKHIAEIIH